MSQPILYRITVPVFILQLEALRDILRLAAESCKAGNHDEKKLIESRVAPDMLPFAYQIQTCCKVTKILSLIAPVPEFTNLPASSDDPNDMLGWVYESFAELDSRVTISLEYLRSIDAKIFEGKEDNEVQFINMKFDTTLSFVQDFVFPNFFFHKTTAYNLLRTAGVELSKTHFLGKIGGK